MAVRKRTRARRRAPARKAAAKRPRRAAPKPRATAARRAPKGAPNPLGILMHHMDYSSHDMDQVRRFYTETLGFGNSNYDPKFGYLWVQTGASSSLGFMPPMPGPPEQWRPPREPVIHLIVSDVDRAHRVLTGRGVVFEQSPTDMPWGYRTAVLRDPEGRLIILAQEIRAPKKASR